MNFVFNFRIEFTLQLQFLFMHMVGTIICKQQLQYYSVAHLQLLPNMKHLSIRIRIFFVQELHVIESVLKKIPYIIL